MDPGTVAGEKQGRLAEVRPPWLRELASGIGMVALLAMGPLLVTAGLAAPLWAVLLLMGFWLTLVVVGFLWFSRRPGMVLALPLLAGAAWLILVAVGEGLGWTA